MKTTTKLPFLRTTTILFVFVLFFTSCSSLSITQRRYNKGFHFEWVKSQKSTTNPQKETIISQSFQEEIAIGNESEQLLNSESNKEVLLSDKIDNKNSQTLSIKSKKPAKLKYKNKNGDIGNKTEKFELKKVPSQVIERAQNIIINKKLKNNSRKDVAGFFGDFFLILGLISMIIAIALMAVDEGETALMFIGFALLFILIWVFIGEY